ncbi:hypothetical protein [Sphingopyxis sp.]|uniref:hypothetical protein n=1 Tax=Sphingopyxis sp. TaxID=1908224 RepID=UPI0035AFA56A
MELTWAAFSAIWTLAAWFLARGCLRMVKRWDDVGEINNGLGYLLRRETHPTAFALACKFNRFMSLLGFLFVMFGIAVTIGWIVKAL